MLCLSRDDIKADKGKELENRRVQSAEEREQKPPRRNGCRKGDPVKDKDKNLQSIERGLNEQ